MTIDTVQTANRVQKMVRLLPNVTIWNLEHKSTRIFPMLFHDKNFPPCMMLFRDCGNPNCSSIHHHPLTVCVRACVWYPWLCDWSSKWSNPPDMKTFANVFQKTLRRCSLLSDVYARGNKRSFTGVNVQYRGHHISWETNTAHNRQSRSRIITIKKKPTQTWIYTLLYFQPVLWFGQAAACYGHLVIRRGISSRQTSIIYNASW